MRRIDIDLGLQSDRASLDLCTRLDRLLSLYILLNQSKE